MKTQKSPIKTKNNSYILRHLKQCTEYCVSVIGLNEGGSSDISETVCNSTESPALGHVKLQDVNYESNLISWKYTADNCPKWYKVKLWVKNNKDLCYNEYKTNETSIKMPSLILNISYKIQVEVHSLGQTVNGEMMKQSSILSFFNGKKLNIERVGKINTGSIASKNIYYFDYEIKSKFTQFIFEYDVVFRDSLTKKCFMRYIVKNKCVYKPKCAKNAIKLNEMNNDVSGNGEGCNRQNETEYCIKDSFKFNFTNMKMDNVSVSLYGRTHHGWSAIHVNSKATKEPGNNSLIIYLLLSIGGLVLVVIIIFIVKSKKNRNSLVALTVEETIDLNEIQNNVQTYANNREEYMEDEDLDDTEEVAPVLKPKKKRHVIQILKFKDLMSVYSKDSNAYLIAEYKKLNLEAKSLTKELALTTNAAKLESNSKKNRFANILPYDQTRIKLKDCKFPLNYINANKIPFVDNNGLMEFLACQGPLKETAADFMQMLWDQNIDCIVMLTQTMESGKSKCLQYWPDEVNESEEFGKIFEITLECEEVNNAFIERKLLLKNKKLNQIRSILHIQMHTWNDYSAPNLEYFDKLLIRFQQLCMKDISAPYIVHCSAGVGRTGTFIVLDRLTREILNGATQIDIYDTVLNLRRFRMMMVQRAAQYVFIHEYLDHFLQTYSNIKDIDDVYFNE